MATLQNIGALKYRGTDGQWHPLPVVVQDASGGGGVSTISGKGAPTSTTVGAVNQLYRDENTDKLYVCTSTENGYTWAEVTADVDGVVKYTEQSLTNEQKAQARTNIGAGTSNFSGAYNDLSGKPTIPSVPSWAMAATKPTYTAAEVGALPSTTVIPDVSGKVDKQQGVDNAGKILGIGDDGAVVPTDKPTFTDTQINTAVSSWLTEHPEATTTVADGSVTPKKTSFFEQETESIYDAFSRKADNKYAIKNDGTYYLHYWNKNTNMVADASDYDKIIVSAVASYINYLWFAEEPTNANGQTVLGYGGTYNGYTNLNGTDANEPVEHIVTISRPEGAVYLIIDFGYTLPVDLQIAIPIEKYRFTDVVDKTVTTAELSDGAVTGDKIADGSVTDDKIVNASIRADKLNGYDVWNREAKWEIFLDNYNTTTNSVYADENSAIYSIKLEAGKSYLICNVPYPSNTNQFMGNPTYTDNNYYGYYLFYTELPDVVQLTLAGKSVLTGHYSASIINGGISTSINNGYMTTSSTYSPGAQGVQKYITMTRDIYILRASLKPTDSKMINNYRFYEVPGDVVCNAGDANSANKMASVYYKDLGNGFAATNYYVDSLLAAPLATPKNEREYFAMSRDVPRDRSLYIQFIGDSITYAASNAGLQNAFRKYVPMDLCAPTKCLCQSGISVTTNGGSFDWKGKLSTADDYDATMTGYSGLATVLAKSDDNPNATEYEFLPYIWRQNVDIVVVALGTNDHWNSSPLGSVSTLDDDTTFYGAVEKTLTLLENTYPNAHILWLLPFKNSKWNVNNDAGCTMLDYLIALKILCQTHERVWTLDLFDKWYLDYDNEALRSKFFIDGVHITGNAHKCVAEAMVDKIRQIISIKGLRRTQTVNITDNSDKIYGAATTT